MDSGLRGNWAYEVGALVESGRRVALLASFPDAGRRCDQGTIYINDVPVLDSPFGSDPRNKLWSNRPEDYLKKAGCTSALKKGDVLIFDANTNEELDQAALQAIDQGRMLVGTTGGIESYIRQQSKRVMQSISEHRLEEPILVVCGSLHSLSREQLARLNCPKFTLTDEDKAIQQALAREKSAVLATPSTESKIDDATANATVNQVTERTWHLVQLSQVETLVVIGGDTAEGIIGRRVLKVRGTVDVCVPISDVVEEGLTLITKGGGIGSPSTLQDLINSN